MRFLWMLSTILSVVLRVFSEDSEPPNHEEEFFIRQIFNLYGDDYHLSFEGFEHLMENLGLGRLKFDKNHSLAVHKISDGSFVEVHDSLNLHKHNHSRPERSVTVISLQEKCLSPEALLSLYGLDPGHRVSISPQGFMRICPAIVYQLDRRLCADSPALLDNHRHPQDNSISSHVWIGASLSILVISLSGLLGVAVVPFLERSLFRRLLSTLVALAVGTLCGDALLHLLPHAYGLEDNEKAILKSTATFLSLMGFFIVEALITIKQTYKRKRKDKARRTDAELMRQEGDESRGDCKERDEERRQHNHRHSHKNKGIGSVAWMVISGDSLHNITDGLAVGAAFRADLVSGFATAVAVLTHELPHELGDFAVLLKSGMSIKQAVWINILSSVLSFIGMIIGVLLGNIESATNLIYCITAGCFLYIGLADLVPELHKYRSEGDVVPTLLFQLCGMFCGGAIMFVIALYEHWFRDLLAGIS